MMTKEEIDQQTVEHLIKWKFNADGLFVNDLERAAIMTALRLTIIREYPILCRFPLLRFFAFLWLQLREFFRMNSENTTSSSDLLHSKNSDDRRSLWSLMIRGWVFTVSNPFLSFM